MVTVSRSTAITNFIVTRTVSATAELLVDKPTCVNDVLHEVTTMLVEYVSTLNYTFIITVKYLLQKIVHIKCRRHKILHKTENITYTRHKILHTKDRADNAHSMALNSKDSKQTDNDPRALYDYVMRPRSYSIGVCAIEKLMLMLML